MQTNFSITQLLDPETAGAEAAIRKCVHCGFCLATCPTYVLSGNELDSPRGRIYLIKEMLEKEQEPTTDVVKHVDRCLSCLSCMTTCPSGVDYAHLVEHARGYIERRGRRGWSDRFFRFLLATILPYPRRFRLALCLAGVAKPFRSLIDKGPAAIRPLSAMLDLAPETSPRFLSKRPPRNGQRKGRVLLLQGCAEPVLQPGIREATLRLIDRMNYEVRFAKGEVCCGALDGHLGREAASKKAARRNIDAWLHEAEVGEVEAILITASGCGTAIKDYGHLLRGDTVYAVKAARISALAKDISEWLVDTGLPPSEPSSLRIAFHAPCSLQHGQRVDAASKSLLIKAGFEAVSPKEAHLCCGSAGIYNILQAEMATKLRDRKLQNIDALKADAIATGNIGCMTQLALGSAIPVLHTVELLDWATGGPPPAVLAPTPAETE